MRVLFLTSEFPYPPFAGAPLRNFGLIEGLAEHEIWLLSFTGTVPVDVRQTPLHTICAQIKTVNPPVRGMTDRLRDLLLSAEADIARRYFSTEFMDQLATWLTSTPFDLIQIENLEMTAYLPLIKQLQPDTPVIYDAHNAEYALQQRIYETERRSLARIPGALYSFVQAQRVRALERKVCETVDYVVAVSDTDAQLLRDLGTNTPVAVVSNGISTAHYKDRTGQAVDLQHPALVFTGKMDYRPNVDAVLWFAQEILPYIRQDLPDAHFYVVGQSPHARLDVLHGQPGISITGLVPEILPYLQAASIFVVPLRMGSGTRLKVLEAMAVGCPIVSTRIGAQGLTVTDGRELLLADTAKEFAKAVVKLNGEPDAIESMGRAARQFVAQHYDWTVLLPRLKAIYKELGVE